MIKIFDSGCCVKRFLGKNSSQSFSYPFLLESKKVRSGGIHWFICRLRIEDWQLSVSIYLSLFLCSFCFYISCTQTCPIRYILHPCSSWTNHFLFLSILPSSICIYDKPLQPLSTCPAYFILLFIMSFMKCNSFCICLKAFVLVLLLYPYNLSAVSFCNTTSH